MITYAQNFEDVILKRALHDIKKGRYADIGAFHPEIDSVTRWFYGQGWTGVNVEPNPRFFELLSEARPHDTNLSFAVAGAEGVLKLRLLDGLSTTVDAISEQHARKGLDVGNVVEVQAVTLNHIFDQYLAGEVVDFLKIDIEGAEAEVIKSFDLSRHRPRIIVVEATLPDSQTDSSHSWAGVIANSGYIFALHDGLNLFYVRKEDEERLEYFKFPPNVFDNFMLSGSDRRIDFTGGQACAEPGVPLGGMPGLLAQRDEFAARHAQMAQQIVELQQSASFQSGELAATQRHLESVSNEAIGLRGQLEILESAKGILGDQLNQSRHELHEARRQLDKVRRQLDEARSELAELRPLRNTVAAAQERLDELTAPGFGAMGQRFRARLLRALGR